jgi:hypothetical protein
MNQQELLVIAPVSSNNMPVRIGGGGAHDDSNNTELAVFTCFWRSRLASETGRFLRSIRQQTSRKTGNLKFQTLFNDDLIV